MLWSSCSMPKGHPETGFAPTRKYAFNFALLRYHVHAALADFPSDHITVVVVGVPGVQTTSGPLDAVYHPKGLRWG